MVFVESEAHGVRICHPEDWFFDDTFFIVMSSNPDVDLFSEGSQIDEGVAIIVFAGPAEEMGANESPEALFGELAEQFATESENVEIISGPEQTEINDMSVLTTDFEITEEGEAARGKIAIYDNGEQAAVVIAVSPVDQWDDHADTVGDIMGCVELFEGSGLGFELPEDENTLAMGAIAIGESMAGMLAEGEGHSWTLSVEESETVDVIVTPLDEEMDLVVTLLAADGTMVGYYDDSGTDEPEEIWDIALEGGSEYFIRVEEFWEAGGSYTLEIIPSEERGGGAVTGGGDWTDMGGLELGEVVESTLEPDERHAWTFTVQSGDVLDIGVNPLDPELDVTFSVVAPNGSPLVPQYDEGFTGEAEELMGLRFDWSGGYTIIIEEFWGEAGTYQLWIEPSAEGGREGDVLEVGSLAYGEIGEETLEAGENLYHLWSFEGAASDVVTLVVEPLSADADLMLGLVDPDGNILVELVDETGSDEPEQISGYELPITGAYLIVVTEYWDEYAEYRLTLELD